MAGSCAKNSRGTNFQADQVTWRPDVLQAQTQAKIAMENVGKVGIRSQNIRNQSSNLAWSIAQMQSLEQGWDGEDAEPISAKLIDRAQEFWNILYLNNFMRVEIPDVFPGRENVVGFVWSNPAKRLDVWLHDDEAQFAEWTLTATGKEPSSGDAMIAAELLEVVFKYMTE
jgi:hypothetical protein